MKQERNQKDKYIDQLLFRIGRKYIEKHREVDYRNEKIDLLCKLYTGKFDAYEIKLTEHPQSIERAKKKLYSIKEDYPDKINELFLYTGLEGDLMLYEPQIDGLFRVFNIKENNKPYQRRC